MADNELVELARGADRLPPDRAQRLRGRLPRWGDLYDLGGIVEGLRCACRFVSEERGEFGPLQELAAVAAAELLRGRAEVAKMRASPLSPEVSELVEMDRIISAGLREGKPIQEIIKEVDERQSKGQTNGRPGPSQVEHT